MRGRAEVRRQQVDQEQDDQSTLLGAAGEAPGHDRHLKSNTSKKRTHSLFRQGAMLYDLTARIIDPICGR
jgi:hypothetical protein